MASGGKWRRIAAASSGPGGKRPASLVLKPGASVIVLATPCNATDEGETLRVLRLR